MLFVKGNDSNHQWQIGDLGLSQPTNNTSSNNEIYGVIPYIAPEVFIGSKFSKEADIYSFGMIMWELITGRIPFWDQNNDIELIVKICKNFRPPIIKNTPKGYTELMQKCWDSSPNKRPTSLDILEGLLNIERVEKENPTEIIKSLDIGSIRINDLGKSKPLSKIINSTESIRSSESQSIASTLGK